MDEMKAPVGPGPAGGWRFESRPHFEAAVVPTLAPCVRPIVAVRVVAPVLTAGIGAVGATATSAI